MLLFDSKTRSANGAFGRHDRRESAGIRAVTARRADYRSCVNGGLMDFSLADEEIRLLKELKGAGELGRIFPQAQSVLARLIRAGYVKRRVIKLSADRYVITALGALALNNAMEESAMSAARR